MSFVQTNATSSSSQQLATGAIQPPRTGEGGLADRSTDVHAVAIVSLGILMLWSAAAKMLAASLSLRRGSK